MFRKKRKGSQSHRDFGNLGHPVTEKTTNAPEIPLQRCQQGGGQRVSFAALEPRCLLAGLPTLIDIIAGAGSSNSIFFTNVNNIVFFGANNGTNGFELWKTDGTAAGTVMVKDIFSGTSSSSPSRLTNVNGTLFFQANDGASGFELWKSDGTAAGDRLGQ